MGITGPEGIEISRPEEVRLHQRLLLISYFSFSYYAAKAHEALFFLYCILKMLKIKHNFKGIKFIVLITISIRKGNWKPDFDKTSRDDEFWCLIWLLKILTSWMEIVLLKVTMTIHILYFLWIEVHDKDLIYKCLLSIY